MEKKVDVYMATLWRQGHAVFSINSLRFQKEFGTATITCNNWTDEQFSFIDKSFCEDPRITLHRHNNEKGSNEKLRYIHEGINDYICLADDDLLYAPDYLEFMIKGVDKYNAYCSLHGSTLLMDMNNRVGHYYRDRVVYSGIQGFPNDTRVDIASNCGSVFKRSFFDRRFLESWYDDCSNVSMDDIYTNYYAKYVGVKRMVLGHPKGYITHKVQYEEDNYVFNKHALTGDDKIQTDFINNIFNQIKEQ